MRRVSVLAPLIASGCLLALACERRPGSPVSSIRIDTLPSGAIFVHNSGPGRWAGSKAWRVEELLRIGVLEGDDAYVFGQIGALEVDAVGNIHVFDQHANELRTFSPSGEHLRTVGRAGAGPGEFRGVVGMAFGPDGRLFVVDGTNARYTIVDGAGEITLIPRPSRRALPPMVGGFDGQGRFYDPTMQSVDGEFVDMLLEVGERGDVVRTHRIPRLEAQVIRLNGGGVSASLPYAAKVLRAWDPRGGVWQALSSAYTIARIGLNGDTVMVVSRDRQPVPLSPEQSEALANAARQITAQFGGQVSDAETRKFVPPLRWFVPDDEGRLWVCATGLEPCGEVDVFDSDGTFLGTVPLPTPVLDSPLPIVRKNTIYAAVEGPMGEPQVFVGRVVMD